MGSSHTVFPIFINEAIVYRDLSKNNEILQNYSPMIVHGRQWGRQRDIPVKMKHETK
jgi:hypothetical protein